MNLSFYSNFLNGLANQENQITTLQQQISTGSTVQNAAQNPTAYGSAALANDQISQLTNDATTQSVIQTRLGAATSAYGSMSSLLDNVQSLVEQGLNGASSSVNLNALSQQIQAASQQLLSLGNTQLPDGSYLFGGTRGNIPPFQVDNTGNTPGGIAYFGDSGQSLADIDGNIAVNTLVNGNVLTSALDGNGLSDIQANSNNTGTTQILQQGVANTTQANAFQASGSSINIAFSKDATSGAIIYTATQGLSPNQTTLKTGTLDTSSGGQTNLSLDGMNFQITGTPEAGDNFTISPAKSQTAFSLLQQISTAFSNAGNTPAQVAQTNQILNQSLSELDQYQQNITVAQAQNGVTIQALANAQTNSSAQKAADQTTVNNATAIDMPAAITALNQTMTALEASMKTFAEVQSLSLFKYL